MEVLTFKVYSGAFIPEVGEPIVIVTDNLISSYDESNEYFLFFLCGEEQIIALRINGQISTYRKAQLDEVSEHTGFQPALTFAREKLRYLMNKKYLESKDISFLNFSCELIESTYFHLYSLYASGSVKRETLEYIGNNTINRDLKQYLKAILNGPKFEVMDLSKNK